MSTDTPSIGKEISVTGARIVGVVSCVPKRIVTNDEFAATFEPEALASALKMIGVETRRHTDALTTTSDLCITAGQHLLQKLAWDPASIDAVIFVSQTPDHVLPATACVIQHALKLSQAGIAFDVNLGCSGYVYALWLGMTMIQSGAAKRVLLAVGDTVSKIVDPKDRATALLFGDAGTMTALEASGTSESCHFVLGSDGAGAPSLIVPDGGFKPAPVKTDAAGQVVDQSHLYMDGGEIFNFTLRTIPALVARLMAISNTSVDQQDYFLFHQANLFMLNHLVKKVKIPKERAPVNIQEYGNTSSASIPLLMTSRLRELLLTSALKLSLFGFGVGYSWGGAALTVGPLTCVETIEQ